MPYNIYNRYRHTLVIVFILSIILTLGYAYPSSADVCEGSTDALKIMQSTVQAVAQAGAAGAENLVQMRDLYKNKWLVSCAILNGIQNLEAAADYITQPEAMNAIASVVAENNQRTSYSQGGFSTGGVMDSVTSVSGSGADYSNTSAGKAVAIMATNIKDLAKNPAFKTSIADRTRVIGLLMLFFTFLIHIICLLYKMFIGSSEGNIEPIDFALSFIKLVTLLTFIMFMKPLALYGMQISTLIANMLVDTPLATTIASDIGYSGAGAYVKGEQGKTPFTESSASVTSPFGWRKNPFGEEQKLHNGVDFAYSAGTPLKSEWSGTAQRVNDGKGGGWCIYFIPDQYPTQVWQLMHLSERSIADPKLDEQFQKGKPVHIDDGIIMGKTGGVPGTPGAGRSTGAHLHLSVKVNGVNQDPGKMYAINKGTISTSSASSGTPTAGDDISGGAQQNTGVASSYVISGNDIMTVNSLFNEVLELRAAGIMGKEMSLINFMNSGWQSFFAFIVGSIAKWLSNAVIYILLILSDVMMAITLALCPIIVALTFVPPFENYLQNWIKGYVTFLFYQPLTACFTAIAFVMMSVTADSGLGPFIILCVCYFVGCLKIPAVADSMSTNALMGAAMMMAFAPAVIAMKATALGVGLAAGGPAAAAVANSVTNAGANIARGTSSKGAVKTKFVMIMLLFVMLFSIIAVPMASGATTKMSKEEKKAIMNIFTIKTYPSPEVYEAVKNAIAANNKKTGGMTSAGNQNKTEYKIQIYDDGTKDGLANGVYNTSYANAIDLPITRYVLGKAVIDASSMYELAFMANYNKPLEEATNVDIEDFNSQTGFLGQLTKYGGALAAFAAGAKVGAVTGALGTPVGSALGALGGGTLALAGYYIVDKVANSTNHMLRDDPEATQQMRARMQAKGLVISAFLNEVQDSITKNLMRKVPVLLLIMMFLIQICTISYIKIVEPHIGDKASYISLCPRFVFTLILIMFFREFVGVMITTSNYISNAIVPIEVQSDLMSNIVSKTGAFMPGSGFSNLLAVLFRLLTYMSIKILLIARDVFMTITCVVGPICIALGYYTRYRSPDPIHQFFTGWLEGFIKLLFWGPLASIMLMALGLLSVLTSMDMLSTISVAITSLAFLYAAGNIPNLADKMSSVAMAGLLTAMSPYILSGIGMATSSAAKIGRWGVGSLGKTGGIAGGLGSINMLWGGGGKNGASPDQSLLNKIVGDSWKTPPIATGSTPKPEPIIPTQTNSGKPIDFDTAAKAAKEKAAAEAAKLNKLTMSDTMKNKIKDLSDAFNTKDISANLKNKTLNDILYGNSGLLDSQMFNQRTGLNNEDKTVAAAMFGLVSAKMALNGISRKFANGQITKDQFEAGKFQIEHATNEMEQILAGMEKNSNKGNVVNQAAAINAGIRAASVFDNIQIADQTKTAIAMGNTVAQLKSINKQLENGNMTFEKLMSFQEPLQNSMAEMEGYIKQAGDKADITVLQTAEAGRKMLNAVNTISKIENNNVRQESISNCQGLVENITGLEENVVKYQNHCVELVQTQSANSVTVADCLAIQNDVFESMPISSRNFLQSMPQESVDRIYNDLRSGRVTASQIFIDDPTTERAMSVYNSYGIDQPTSSMDHVAFEVMGMSMMSNIAQAEGRTEVVNTIDQNIANIQSSAAYTYDVPVAEYTGANEREYITESIDVFESNVIGSRNTEQKHFAQEPVSIISNINIPNINGNTKNTYRDIERLVKSADTAKEEKEDGHKTKIDL